MVVWDVEKRVLVLVFIVLESQYERVFWEFIFRLIRIQKQN